MHTAVQPCPISLRVCTAYKHNAALCTAWTATKVRSSHGILLYLSTYSWPPTVSLFPAWPQIASSRGKPTHPLTSHQLLPRWPFPTWLRYSPSLLKSPTFPSYSRNFWKQRIEMRSWEFTAAGANNRAFTDTNLKKSSCVEEQKPFLGSLMLYNTSSHHWIKASTNLDLR